MAEAVFRRYLRVGAKPAERNWRVAADLAAGCFPPHCIFYAERIPAKTDSAEKGQMFSSEGPLAAHAEAAAAAGERSRASRLLRSIFSYPAALAAGLVLITVLSLSNRFDNPDLWWQLKIGEDIWNTHAIPSSDSFSFTAAGHPWTAHEWLAEVSMYAAYKLAGYRGLMVWVSALASLTFLLVYLLCWLLTGNALASFRNAMVAWCFGTVGLNIRPLIVGHFFLAAEILILELARMGRSRWLWLLPPLFAVWVNCHGSYVFGMALLAVYLVCSRVKANSRFTAEEWDPCSQRRLAWTLALSAAALCCNPVGLRLWLYPFDTMLRQTSSMNAIQEWLPPNLREPRTLAMLAAIVGIFLLSMLRRTTLSLRELLLLLMGAGLAVRYLRMMFLFGIVISPILCRFGFGRGEKRDHPLANALILFGCLAAVIWSFPTEAALEKQVERMSPVQAVHFIRRTNLTGRMLNDYAFGGYLIWSLPERKVFIDGRGDVFDWTGVLDEYVRWVNLQEDPALLLEKYKIDFCILAQGSSIAHVMPYLPGWKQIYADDVAVIFSRETAR